MPSASLRADASTSLFQDCATSWASIGFDISTDANGQTNVGVGQAYLNERTYIELQQNTTDGAKAIINLDVGRGVKLRGAAGANGAGEAGVVSRRNIEGGGADAPGVFTLSAGRPFRKPSTKWSRTFVSRSGWEFEPMVDREMRVGDQEQFCFPVRFLIGGPTVRASQPGICVSWYDRSPPCGG